MGIYGNQKLMLPISLLLFIWFKSRGMVRIEHLLNGEISLSDRDLLLLDLKRRRSKSFTIVFYFEFPLATQGVFEKSQDDWPI